MASACHAKILFSTGGIENRCITWESSSGDHPNLHSHAEVNTHPINGHRDPQGISANLTSFPKSTHSFYSTLFRLLMGQKNTLADEMKGTTTGLRAVLNRNVIGPEL